MALENLSFDNGVKIPEYKELSENSDLIVAKVPKTVTIPLTQHIGAPSKCLVKKNDEVKVGELIGEAVGNFSCNIHSSVSGKVTNV
ncbi:MAG: electron transport complex subunit RsxC, partial [Anaerococcus hydrogenalis]|nr:electron transport complex subunit RsxC [Anaerococcus hydrogenalis]